MLGLFAIFLTTSCASCKKDFDWSPRPYVGDSVNEQIVNGEGEVVTCSQPIFDQYTCFDPDNIAELKTAIDQVEKKSVRKKLQEAVRKVETKVNKAKNNM